jgi:hypothetical protein
MLAYFLPAFCADQLRSSCFLRGRKFLHNSTHGLVFRWPGRNASGTENINEILINQALREVGEPTGGGMSRNRLSLITLALAILEARCLRFVGYANIHLKRRFSVDISSG